jgi:hypothetical protein
MNCASVEELEVVRKVMVNARDEHVPKAGHRTHKRTIRFIRYAQHLLTSGGDITDKNLLPTLHH